MAREVLSLYAAPPPSPNEDEETKMPPPRPIPEKQRYESRHVSVIHPYDTTLP